MSAVIDHSTLEQEFLWSLFSAAATNFRSDTLLRPFPPPFITEGGSKDLESLVGLFNT